MEKAIRAVHAHPDDQSDRSGTGPVVESPV